MIDFALQNWFWLFLAAASGSGMIWTFARGGAKRLDPARAVALVNLERGVFVDIRGDEEFARGHIARARHIPIDKIDSRADDLTKFRDKPVVVVCGNGLKAPQIERKLAARGFQQTFALAGGVAAWIESQLPLVSEARKKRLS